MTRSRWFRWLGPLLGLAFVVLLFGFLSGDPLRFVAARNLRIVAAQTVIVSVGAVGMTLIIVSGGIDLSVGASIALTSVVTAVSLLQGWAPLTAALAGIAIGGVIGLVNGMVVTRLKVVPFIATLGMMGAARGAAKWIASEQTVNPPATWLNRLAVSVPDPPWLLVAPGVWLAVGLALLFALILGSSVFGRRVYTLGSNEAAARACGIPVERLKLMIYTVGGFCFGLAGVLQMSRLRQGDPTVAQGTELDVIAAVVIGGASLNGGEGGIGGSMVGALIMAFLRNGCQQMGWPNYIQEIIIGITIVAAVALDRWRASRPAL